MHRLELWTKVNPSEPPRSAPPNTWPVFTSFWVTHSVAVVALGALDGTPLRQAMHNGDYQT